MYMGACIWVHVYRAGVHLDTSFGPPHPPILGGERAARGGERGGPNEGLWDRGARGGERGWEPWNQEEEILSRDMTL